jgi:hypothetical protein
MTSFLELLGNSPYRGLPPLYPRKSARFLRQCTALPFLKVLAGNRFILIQTGGVIKYTKYRSTQLHILEVIPNDWYYIYPPLFSWKVVMNTKYCLQSTQLRPSTIFTQLHRFSGLFFAVINVSSLHRFLYLPQLP